MPFAKVLVPAPVMVRFPTERLVVVAFVVTKLVLKVFVLVALVEVLFVVVSPVSVARVPKRLVMVPVVAERMEEKKEVDHSRIVLEDGAPGVFFAQQVLSLTVLLWC